MLELSPITAHVVAPAHAAQVIAPAYDSLDPGQREALAARQPDSFLRALPSRTVDDATLRRNRDAVARLLRSGRFGRLTPGLLVVLELTDHGRRLTAVVGGADVAAYLDGRIRPHELVRPDRVEQLARYLDQVAIASSPVCVLHQRSQVLDRATTAVRASPPSVDVTLPDGGGVRLWPVTEPAAVAGLGRATRSLQALTIADGHHRAAAVARRGGDRQVLTALVASDELAVEPFHRRIDALGQVTAEEVSAVLAERGLTLAALPGPSAPERRGTVHLVVAGSWWRVDIGDRRGVPPVGTLDAAIVERELLAPLATLAPGPGPAPLTPIPGPMGLAPLDRPGAVGLALLPPTMDELLAITSRGEVLPHKSTYLLPKLRSGVLIAPN